MHGDPAAIRRLADVLRDQGDEIRAEADRLVALTEATAWTGLAADALRGRVRDRAAALRRTAVRHEDAAAALERHAREVARRQELIAGIERRVARLLDGLTERWPVDRFVPPPSGHRAWLEVDVAGLLGAVV
ncbi:hypothetical protein I601_1507 [Nocardioides dokdonensis FR1436]|uniref:Putative T7SS secretion signal domain-containing protein n=1 Tax=Nocardioides dokdonensis FR1436 TaxID=1300347 RepID=A0A1A9GJU9_9ACTN|nr:hypothetical protein [Nocardioides dokdonensis]ANH37942.1 hypothetical protein I601_1507 [Nocardioides dokdonensis FR1436]